MLDLDALARLEEALPECPSEADAEAEPAPAPVVAEARHVCPHLAAVAAE